jgi:hypothetical protein
MTITIGGPITRRGATRQPVSPVRVAIPPPLDPSGPSVDAADEPPLPDEARAAEARAAAEITAPVEARPDQTLHVRFADAPDERIVAAFTELRTLIKSRPGATPVVLHIPAGRSRSREMRLGVGIAYDAELLAEVARSFGGLLRLRLA